MAAPHDGIEDEKKALEVDPEYENAMAYMNLLIRYRADLDDTKEQYHGRLKEADSWVQKSLETTKMKAKRKKPPMPTQTNSPLCQVKELETNAAALARFLC